MTQLKKCGRYRMVCVTFLKRSPELDLPTSNFTQIFTAFSNEVDADVYVYVHATAPFISQETIKQCVEAVRSGEYDSAFCATKIQDFLWKDGEPLNFDAANIPRSQDLEPIYRETSGFYAFTKEVFKRTHRRIGLHPFIKEVTFVETGYPGTTELAYNGCETALQQHPDVTVFLDEDAASLL